MNSKSIKLILIMFILKTHNNSNKKVKTTFFLFHDLVFSFKKTENKKR